MNQDIQPRDPEPTIPVKLKNDFEPPMAQLSHQEKVEEAVKVVKIMHHINPNESELKQKSKEYCFRSLLPSL